MRFSATPLVIATSALLAACGSSVPNPNVPAGTTLELAVLSTTDLHQNLLSYDYYRLAGVS
ncbi:hypothetical protein Q6325_27425, partial [Klebsiella pneumoniae]|uniref:hypothetical protein n=1 Tax=Klebsiella pneumoniae TaxID=573 RepID=UPI00272EF809